MKKIGFGFCILFLVGVLAPLFASAETVFVSGALTSDTVWESSNVYVIDSSFSVASGVTLTINPGTIIKAKSTGLGGPSIYGRLVAIGTSEVPIYFTSIYDDSIGGDTDEHVGESYPGEWQGLYFKSGSEGDLQYVDLYHAGNGGYGYGNFVGIENDGGIVEIKNSRVHKNYKIVSNGAGGTVGVGTGIYNKSGTLSVTDSIIENNVNGIRVDGGTVTISNNEIINNVDSTGYSQTYGVSAYGPGKLTLLNNNFSGNARTAFIEVSSKEFIHSGNTTNDLSRRAFHIGGTLSQNITLTSGDLPYILEYLVIPVGQTFTIEPGVVIKMEDRYSNGAIYVNGGNLIAKGAPENKIYITSLKDDLVGGDINVDGDATTPAPRDWNAIYLEEGSKADFENVVVRYGGYNFNGEYLPGVAAAIYHRGAEFSVKDSLFEYNRGAALYQDAGTTTIESSQFANGDYGVWSRGGSIEVSKSRFENNVGYGVYNQSGIDLGWWWQTRPLQIIDARNNWWGSSSGPKDTSDPNSTSTGTLVSENVLYTPFATSWPIVEENVIHPVIIVPGIMGSAYKNGNWVIDPVFHVYDNLIETLEKNGYIQGENLFPWGYDWKKSNTDTAVLLKQKIDEIKELCDCERVDVVAHSMGGLVTRAYVQSSEYENDIDQVVFLGTPHEGVPKDYVTWEAGEFVPDNFSFFVESHYKKEAKRLGYESLFDYIHDWPIKSVEELLPISNYLHDATTGQVLDYPTGYPINTFLENLKQGLVAFLEEDIDITNIISETENTITGIRIVDSDKLPLWQHGYPQNYDSNRGDRGLVFGQGDGTVPRTNASLSESVDLVIESSHINLPTDAMEEIFAEIHGGELEDTVKTSLPLKILFAKIFSPADFVVIAPDGKRVGKDFATGQEINEIPGAFYSGFEGDDEYVTIPDPIEGQYKIELQGTGEGGSYSFETTFISEATSTTSEIFGITAPNQITEVNLKVDNQNPGQMDMERQVTLDVLISDINMSYDLGWISDLKVKNELVRKAKLLVKFEKRRNGKYEKIVDKLLVKVVDKELDKLFEKGKINLQAMDLLKKDLQYIINNN